MASGPNPCGTSDVAPVTDDTGDARQLPVRAKSAASLPQPGQSLTGKQEHCTSIQYECLFGTLLTLETNQQI
jgi:hypothetical protein